MRYQNSVMLPNWCTYNREPIMEGCLEKALSDITTQFSFQITLYLLVKQKGNLTLHQVSSIVFCVLNRSRIGCGPSEHIVG